MVDCEWMFGDAADGKFGIQALAGLNPFRWSGAVTIEKAIEDLRAVEAHEDRPVIVKAPAGVWSTEHRFDTCQKAIEYLEDHDVKQEKAQEAVVKAQAAKEEFAAAAAANRDAARLDAGKAEQDAATKKAEEAAEAFLLALEAALATAQEYLTDQDNFMKDAVTEVEIRTEAVNTIEKEEVKSDVQAKWMFGDAGRKTFGLQWAQNNPLRWSKVQDFDQTVQDMKDVIQTESRSICLRSPASADKAASVVFDDPQKVIDHLYTICPLHKALKDKLDVARVSKQDAQARKAVLEATLKEAKEKVKLAQKELDDAYASQDGAEPKAKKTFSGKRKALLVGINYKGKKIELEGCIEDAHRHKKVITDHFGYKEADIMVLTDDQEQAAKKPNKANMLKAIHWLFDGAKAGDQLFFSYSGHGTQFIDRTRQEADGMNECICPLDCMDVPWPTNLIIDDELHRLFYDGLQQGVSCVCIFDCCHSGTIGDLEILRSLQAPGKGPPVPRFIDPPTEVKEAIVALPPRGRGLQTAMKLGGTAFKDKLLWMFSGCQDDQTSADAHINGVRQGALSWALNLALQEAHYRITYERLLEVVKKKIKNEGFTQVPALETTSTAYLQLYYMQQGA